ncbi:MAG TPA: aldo/keto reductase [Mesorhizobium sp.]|jgi:aryl-alcohol dehydrogenase-like predicted oxidoreductase|nr:aldo/keto reductase [Mesorhizobium sp.]
MNVSMAATLWNGKTVPRIGIGTWVMGGAQRWGEQSTGWSGVDDNESLATLHEAFDMGVRIIDTADQYGGGHAEEIIAQALRDSGIDRDRFVVATKVGMVCDPATRDIVGVTDDRAAISRAIDASLRRLRLDHVDLVKFHLNGHPVEKSQGVFDAFSAAYGAGKIGGFGWSTDDVAGAMAFADRPGFVAVQHDLNLFKPADAMLRAIEGGRLWSFNRQPLAMGLLSGKYHSESVAIGSDDIRGSGATWLDYFDAEGRPSPVLLERIARVRALLTDDGRTPAQGALGWVLAQSDRTIPLPGCRTPAQARDNFAVLEQGPLDERTVAEIKAITGG